MKHAYQTGVTQALNAYGLEKTANARLIGAVLLGLGMRLAAREEDKNTATLLGAGGGYALGAGLSGAFRMAHPGKAPHLR